MFKHYITRESRMTRKPNAGSLRANLIAFWQENPGAMLTRQEIMDRYGVSPRTLDGSISLLKRDGTIKALFGLGHVVSYASIGLPKPRLPKPPKEKAPKPVRAWTERCHYVEPRPIPVSVWHFAEMVAR